MKMFIKLFILLVTTAVYIPNSLAACSRVTTFSNTAYLGSYIVQRDAPIGTTIAFVQFPTPPGTKVATCTNGGHIYDEFTYLSRTPSGIYGVYNTNIPGVGISYLWGNTPVVYPPTSTTYSGATGVYETVPGNLRLVKTGPIGSGSLQSGMVAKAYDDYGAVLGQYYIYGGSVTEVACSVTTPNVNVPLDPVLSSSFTGVNTTRGDKAFTIGLSCDYGTRINASLSFDQNTDTTNTSVINLTGAGSNNVATGVGIQLLYNGSPLYRNSNVILKTSTGGMEFPSGSFTARYYQTKSTVTPGDANATATLNLTYQ